MHTEEEKKILMKIISKKNIYKKKKFLKLKCTHRMHED